MSHGETLTLLDHALTWLAAGFVPLPLKERSKRPSLSWRPLQRQAPPARLVKAWFQEHQGNMGLLCGPTSSFLTVLDFDKALAYHRWASAFPFLAVSYTVKTARGYHVYFKGADWGDARLRMDGGEVKVSGYVVAPPSVHPDGTPYSAIDSAASILHLNDPLSAGLCVRQPRPTPPLGNGQRQESGGYGIIEAIKKALPIEVYLSRITRLERSSPDGTWMMACCPLHNDRHPSMWINTRWGGCRCHKATCRGHERVLDVIGLHAARCNRSNEWAIWDLAAELGL